MTVIPNTSGNRLATSYASVTQGGYARYASLIFLTTSSGLIQNSNFVNGSDSLMMKLWCYCEVTQI